MDNTKSIIKISIIIPVFNVEKFLNKCISSIVNQEVDSDKFEIIAVNDGSTDGSLNVLEEIKKKTKNLKIITQENQGLSGARNTGLENADGQYILFVDSDDYILPNALKVLVEKGVNREIDILEFGAEGVTPENKVTYSTTATTNNEVLTGEQYLSQINYMGSACNKLYRLTFLNENNLRFMPNVYIEDIEFNTRAVFLSKKIIAIKDILAHFLQREGSITRTKNFVKKEKMIFDIFTVLNSINSFTEKNVTKESIAYIPLKKRVSALIATMLLRVLKETKTIKIKKNIIIKLKNQDLYPIVFKPKTKSKKWFVFFANQYQLFSLSCIIFCKYNILRYGR
ncbi:glycosyltransferase [Flavivirga aquimarina]|uniref:Glycosyltransferase n=1 Tax=Flavivirga aquimarina TaxID=2027862 RepID=A0ABT8WD98_9FLAO|nr:glycosyltransferase [Flavivirga aquimarina]MDO5971132.1 glycosyltransferase [Flavivirga aquimarina]